LLLDACATPSATARALARAATGTARDPIQIIVRPPAGGWINKHITVVISIGQIIEDDDRPTRSGKRPLQRGIIAVVVDNHDVCAVKSVVELRIVVTSDDPISARIEGWHGERCIAVVAKLAAIQTRRAIPQRPGCASHDRPDLRRRITAKKHRRH